MLTPEILEYDTHKVILYRRDNGQSIRQLIIDLNNHIIQDSICEYDELGRLQSISAFLADHTTIIGYRKYHYHGDKLSECGYDDYRNVDGKFELLCHSECYWLIKNRQFRHDWYDGNRTFVYYELFEFDDDIGEMIWQFCHDKNGNRIDRPYLELFDDYYLKFI